MFVLMFLGIAAHGEQKKSETGKIYFRNAKKALQANPKKTGQFKHLLVAGNQLSVPGKSEDYAWAGELNDWLHVSNTTYTYNNAGKLIEEIVKEAATNNYFAKNTFSYDSDYILEEISYVWELGEWVPAAGERSAYTISAERQINGVYYQRIINEVWVNKTRIEYILNQYNIPTQLYEYHWDGHNWIAYSRKGLLTWADWPNRELAAYTLQYMQGNNWVNAERYSTQYDGDNYTATTEIWENAEWVNSSRESYSRTETHEEIISENWTESGWKNVQKYRGTADNEGNWIGFQYSSWNDTEWIAFMELFFDLTYNDSKDVTELVYRYWDPEHLESVKVSKYRYSNFLNFTTDVPEISVLNNVKVFPNPVSSTFTIQIDESKITNYQINIVNLAGQTVFSNSYSNPSISVNTEKFTTGMYLLNIKTDDGRIYNSKLLKQ